MEVYTRFVEELIKEKKVNTKKIFSLINEPIDEDDPFFVTKELENWFINLGICDLISSEFSLEDCPFTRDEIIAARQNQEMILCIPKNLTRHQLGMLFRMNSWAVHDKLVADSIEKNDLWFKTKASPIPEFIRECGVDITRKFQDEKKVLFSLEIYLIFIARYKFLYKSIPDSEYWIWLPKGRYDRSGMLIAGFDRLGSFNVHGWMPHFSAGFLGARYGELPKK